MARRNKIGMWLVLVLLVTQFLSAFGAGTQVRAEGLENPPAAVSEAVYGEDPGNVEEEAEVPADEAVMQLAAAGDVITENIISGVKLYNQRPTFVNGTLEPQGQELQEVTPRPSDETAVIYQWTLPDNHPYGAGSTYTFALPDKFDVPSRLSGALDGDIGTYVVEPGGTVTFTFNENIEGQNIGDGYFYVWLAFDESKFGEGLEQEFDFTSVGQGIITVDFANTAQDELKKSGTANKSGFNSDRIDWTVDFNQAQNELRNVQVQDVFTGGQSLIGEIEVYELQVQVNGSVIEKGLLDTFADFPFTLGNTNKAVRLKYATSVTAPTEEPFANREYSNKVTVTADGVQEQEKTGNVRISFNEPLAKSSPGYNDAEQIVTWEVKYNYNQRTIPAGSAWIEDTFSAANVTEQALLLDSVKVYEVTVNDRGIGTRGAELSSSAYDVTPLNGSYTNGFRLTFPQGINQAYDIVYETQAQDRIYANETVTNEVQMDGDIKKGASRGIREVIFAKSVSKEDFKEKEIEWRLVVNKDAKEMTDIVIVDDYAGRNMRLLPDTLEVTGPNSEDFELVANNGDPDYLSGFTVKLKEGARITAEHTIVYTTTFDPTKPLHADGRYANTATLDWKEGGVSQTPIVKEAHVTPESYTRDNGNKVGEYNANDKTITWKIDINYNLFDIQEAIVKDAYTGDQSYVAGSLTVRELVLNTGNNNISLGDVVTDAFKEGFELNADGKGFVLNMGDIGPKAYRIEYKTSLAGEHEIKGTYSNHATLQDGTGPFIFEKGASVTPAHGGKYLDKTGSQAGQSDIANWKIVINPSQSFVAEGAVLSDELSPNQLLLKDTLKLYTTVIPANNTGTITKSVSMPESDYELVVDGNKFTITFLKKLTTAYILEYSSFIDADSGDRLTNKAEFKGQSSSVIGEGNQEGIRVSLAGAGGGASSGTGTIKIVKVDEAGEPLQGATFQLFNVAGTTLLETLTTDANGEAETVREYRLHNVNGINYRLKESAAPSGYVVDEEYGAANGKLIRFMDADDAITVINKQIRQGFELTKTDASNASITLEGAVFELQRQDGTLIDTLTTNDAGRIGAGDLEPGAYQLVEKSAPQYYTVDATPITFTIVANQTELVTLTKTNSRGADARLVVTKVDDKDNTTRLEGVEFELRNSADAVVATETTDADGIVTFTGLPYGPYTLVETKADGYVIEDPETEVSIEQQLTELTITNKFNDRSVLLTKYNAGKSRKLAGAIFELRVKSEIFDANGDYIYDKVENIDPADLTTDAEGELHLSNLPAGEYQLIETRAPVGYSIDRTPIAFEITNTQTEPVTVEKVNYLLPTQPVDPWYPPMTPTPTPTPTPGPTPTPIPGEVVTPSPGPSETPAPAPSPTPTPVPGTPQPSPTATHETTTEEVPVEGEIPLGGVPHIGEEPSNGTVVITPDGKWRYTPNPGFTGKDRFTIIVTDENGNEEEVLIEIDVDEIPLGTAEGNNTGGGTGGLPGRLPQTGENSALPLYLAGGSLIAFGLFMRMSRRGRQTE